MTQQLDILTSPLDIQKMYSESPTSRTYNFLIVGQKGVGKTSVFKTCRKPALIYSFDPGGVTVLKEEIERGEIVVDTRYEQGSSKEFSTYNFWWQNYQAQKKTKGFFEQFSTVGIDSSTFWAKAMLDYMVSSAPEVKRPRGVPCMNDYGALLTTMLQIVPDILSLPCDIIFCNHLMTTKDEVTGAVYNQIIVPGQSKDSMPLYFDEYYVLHATREGKNKINRYFQTANDGIFSCTTRLGCGGKFDSTEEPDICALLEKAGIEVTHKPPIGKKKV